MILREEYLKLIRPYYDDKVIKIIKGLRRSGKSIFINQIIDELKQKGVEDDHIIIINYDLFENNLYTNTAILTSYIKSLLKDSNKYYLFFDEVQNIKDWEKIINLLNSLFNISVFVIGSTINLDSGKYSKYIGEHIVICLYPFTFKEVCNIKKVKNKKDIKECFSNFLVWGSLPFIIYNDNDEVKRTYIIDVYNSIVVKDIVERYKVKDIELLNKMVNYILNNLDEVFSVNNMSKYFETYDRKVSLDTMYNYLEYINSTGLVNKIERYDINNNKIVYGKYKYYLADFNFLNLLGKNIPNLMQYKLENIVYNELIYRGYIVNQAIIGSKNISMCATKNNKKILIDVYDKLDSEEKINNAYKRYKRINIGYDKYILSMDDIDLSKGDVKHLNIIDFLLSEEL